MLGTVSLQASRHDAAFRTSLVRSATRYLLTYQPNCTGFEYLRQSLTCNADLTLEYTSVGWEVEHLCKDPKEVEGFMRTYNEGNEAYPLVLSM